MAKVREQSEVLKAYLKRLGNPYASLQVSDNAEQKDASVVSNVTQRPYVRHPYAYASMEVGSNISSSAIAKPPAKGALAKAEFRAKCRRIFEQYIPTIEKGRLRTHHRDLSPVMSPPPATRYLLVNKLQKYDLSTVPGLKAHFNRERELLTDEKLKQIERLVDSES